MKKLKEILAAQIPKRSEAYWESYTQIILARLEMRRSKSPVPAWRWATALALCFIMIGGSVLHQRRARNAAEIEEVIANLEVFENLNLLTKEDFEKWTVQ